MSRPVRLSRTQSLLFTIVILLSLRFAIAGEVVYLGTQTFRVDMSSNSWSRVAVDYSADLVGWTPLGNFARSNEFVNFYDPGQLSQPPIRFYRMSDADDTFMVAGHVSAAVGDITVGFWPNAKVTIEPGGFVTYTDTNGFFHLNPRFSRSVLPMTVQASIEGMQTDLQMINETNVGHALTYKCKLPAGQSLFLTNLPSGRIHLISELGEAPDKEVLAVVNHGWAELIGATRAAGLLMIEPTGGCLYFGVGGGWSPQFATVLCTTSDGMSGLFIGGNTERFFNRGRFRVERMPQLPPPATLSSLSFTFYEPLPPLTVIFEAGGTGKFTSFGGRQRTGTAEYLQSTPSAWGDYTQLTLHFDDDPEIVYQFHLYFHANAGEDFVNDFTHDQFRGDQTSHTAGTFTYTE
jgi:hypothetical protein